MISWESIIKISEDKIIYSTGVWVFITPALVKIYNASSHNLTTPISQSLVDSSFILLYFAALCFFIPGVICKIICPKIISSTSSFSDFEAKKMNHLNIQEFIENSTDTSNIKIVKEIRSSVKNPDPSDIDNELTFLLEMDCRNSFNVRNSDLNIIYWIIRKSHNTQYTSALIVCVIFYLAGIAMLTSLIISNAKIVAEFAFGT